MHGMRLRFQKGDLLAVAVTLALAVAVFFLFLPRETAEAAMAEIYLDGVGLPWRGLCSLRPHQRRWQEHRVPAQPAGDPGGLR